MLKIQGLGAISVIIALSLTILPQLGFGQTLTSDKLNQSPQCLDFNQDKICEFMVIANGTMVKNPSLDGQTTLTPAANLTVTAPTPETNPKPILPPPLLTIVPPQSPPSYSAPAPQVQAQTTEEPAAGEEAAEDRGSGRLPSDNPYCDVVRQTGEPYESCFDRKDYSDVTGLYPCRDGSNVEDWRDCPDGPEANSNSNPGSEDEEATADDLPQNGGCQEDDDFCDADEGCRSDDIDWVDDRGFDEDDYNG